MANTNQTTTAKTTDSKKAAKKSEKKARHSERITFALNGTKLRLTCNERSKGFVVAAYRLDNGTVARGCSSTHSDYAAAKKALDALATDASKKGWALKVSARKTDAFSSIPTA